TTEGSRFVVDLGSVKLPPIVEKQVETDIRAVVLKALADEPFAARTALPPWIFNHFPGRTLGLWMDPDAHIPWEPTGPLDPTDHTLIVGQVMQYPLQVVRSLGVTTGQAPPTGREVLEAMLDVPEIDPTAKARIRWVGHDQQGPRRHRHNQGPRRVGWHCRRRCWRGRAGHHSGRGGCRRFRHVCGCGYWLLPRLALLRAGLPPGREVRALTPTN